MSFGKSLLIAVSATGTSFTAVMVAGLLSNDALMQLNNPESAVDEAVDPALRTVVMEPVALDRQGYDLKGSVTGEPLFVSVEMTVSRKQARKTVCRLMPRLKAAVLTDLGPLVWASYRGGLAEGPGIDGFVQGRFERALGIGVIEQVKVRFLDHPRQAPEPNCTAALHGGWQKWIKLDPQKDANDR